MTIEYLAELECVHKRFGSVAALNGLDLQVRQGELLALLGPNGAGKSTAISLLLGLQQPDSGSARLFGRTAERIEAHRLMGVMMQEVWPPDELRVRELVAWFASYYPTPYEVDEILEMTQSSAIADRRYGNLSGGQKRQAQFAMAISGRPRLLFLDEPTVGLDIETREMMWSFLRQFVRNGGSAVLTTHYMEEAEALADRVAVLVKGQLVASGSVREVQAHVATRQITCSSTIPIEQIKDWPGVTHVHRSEHRLHMTVNNAESVVRRLLAADENLSELEVSRAGLAEAFTQLTREAA